MPNLIDVLDQFPDLRPSASLLMTQLPKLQPRFYSISSSPKVILDKINVTVGVVEWTPPNKQKRYGVCSKWLEEINLQETVPAFIRGYISYRL